MNGRVMENIHPYMRSPELRPHPRRSGGCAAAQRSPGRGFSSARRPAQPGPAPAPRTGSWRGATRRLFSVREKGGVRLCGDCGGASARPREKPKAIAHLRLCALTCAVNSSKRSFSRPIHTWCCRKSGSASTACFRLSIYFCVSRRNISIHQDSDELT